jgi:uncharacterized protein (TIGR03086 family)
MTEPIPEPIVFERVIDASPEEAFALFTEPERLRRWHGLSAAVDLRVGGDYRLTVVPGGVATGSFTEIEPGRRLVYTWGWHGHETVPPGASTVQVDFEPVGDKTLVRLTHTGLGAEDAANHRGGWTHYLDRLENIATKGTVDPDPWRSEGDMDHLTAAEASWAVCRHVLDHFTSEDRDKQTPCAEYTVHDLVEHLVGSMRGLGRIAGAEIPDEIEASTAEDYVAQAVEPALAAWRNRGLDGEVPFAVGNAPAMLPAGILSLEFLIHAWDFAQATGQAIEPEPALIDYVAGIAQATVRPEFRGEGKGFAAETEPSTDDALTRLMAFTGRAA